MSTTMYLGKELAVDTDHVEIKIRFTARHIQEVVPGLPLEYCQTLMDRIATDPETMKRWVNRAIRAYVAKYGKSSLSRLEEKHAALGELIEDLRAIDAPS